MHTFTRSRQDNGDYLYTVGYWQPAAYDDGSPFHQWQPLQDCASAELAACLVNYLNGGEGDYPQIGSFK